MSGGYLCSARGCTHEDSYEETDTSVGWPELPSFYMHEAMGAYARNMRAVMGIKAQQCALSFWLNRSGV